MDNLQKAFAAFYALSVLSSVFLSGGYWQNNDTYTHARRGENSLLVGEYYNLEDLAYPPSYAVLLAGASAITGLSTLSIILVTAFTAMALAALLALNWARGRQWVALAFLSAPALLAMTVGNAGSAVLSLVPVLVVCRSLSRLEIRPATLLLLFSLPFIHNSMALLFTGVALIITAFYAASKAGFFGKAGFLPASKVLAFCLVLSASVYLTNYSLTQGYYGDRVQAFAQNAAAKHLAGQPVGPTPPTELRQPFNDADLLGAGESFLGIASLAVLALLAFPSASRLQGFAVYLLFLANSGGTFAAAMLQRNSAVRVLIYAAVFSFTALLSAQGARTPRKALIAGFLALNLAGAFIIFKDRAEDIALRKAVVEGALSVAIPGQGIAYDPRPYYAAFKENGFTGEVVLADFNNLKAQGEGVLVVMSLDTLAFWSPCSESFWEKVYREFFTSLPACTRGVPGTDYKSSLVYSDGRNFIFAPV